MNEFDAYAQEQRRDYKASPMPPREVHCVVCNTVFYPDLDEGIERSDWLLFCSEECERDYHTIVN